MELVTLTVLAAAIAGLATLIAQVLTLKREVQSANRAKKTFQDDVTETILAEPRLEELGSYLFDDLGSVHVRDFVRDSTVQKELPRALDAVREYLNPPDDVATRTLSVSISPSDHRTIREGERDLIPDHILSRLDAGDVWTALAWLRREIERALRRLADQHGIQYFRDASVASIISTLSKTQALDREIAELLASSVQVANRGVHGLDVPITEAEEAILLGLEGLESLSR